MPIGKLDHYSIRTLDIEASRRFYTEVMGFSVGFRPPFKFPGIWLYNGAQYPETTGVVHIIGIDPKDPAGLRAYLGERDQKTLKGSGALDHVAFFATGLNRMMAHLKALSIEPRTRSVPNLGLHQIFLDDPNGIVIELNYPASEKEPSSTPVGA